MIGLIIATQAGCCAALASVSAKIATSYEAAYGIIVFLLGYMNSILSFGPSTFLEEGVIVLRLVGVAGIFFFNALMWVLFTKSLHLCSSTLEATAINTSSNFIFTAVAGYLLFGERLSLQWFIGSSFMLLGLLVLHRGSSGELNQDMNDYKEKLKAS